MDEDRTNEEELLTAPELASILKVSSWQVYKMVKLGCPHYRLTPNGQFRFRLKEVEEWMDKNSKMTEADTQFRKLRQAIDDLDIE